MTISWLDENLRKMLKPTTLQRLEELELCFKNQDPTNNGQKAWVQFIFALTVLEGEK